ncbi:KN motif and ankyrin repeat domain-containing protein 4 [Betta splendens]|uniref:KN motif and ankyrin repeat domain-containing protein 4 n=1 Tax=Betta splendens TaxID=158456 RepID=A0A6P7MB52_BETSP|nr:KN motif and ankyrin repeat domain-containing protein 4 [Betta splendens]XP_029003823.1 KN motif and ankyrin repeat domain-containing protein 4 [Betta splendens]XP_029003825.1 KN motif and ankyrin repeat domain-containing protein 4 [Betta splendens]
MMEKRSANGFQTKASDGGAQRKQLPYSVETPYGFHLDLDFLKYVDDIEKGNTIKRVHIQRRVKGPPKFSTLPRNFSLPGHGARPAAKEKDSAWSGTSTLGPKPKSRVTEVQQIFDFRASEGTSSHSSRGAASQGTGVVSAKPKDEVGAGARVDESAAGIQNRPNLLRASSMPITLQQRKGSDSSSPDRALGTPENGSTENMFRASPDIIERRCLPQDRAGLHQQITVALKRVRELEEQVKTIPDLKAQICSLREEREKLLVQLQAQIQAQASTSTPTKEPSTEAEQPQPQGHRPLERLNLDLTQARVQGVQVTRKETVTEKSALQEDAAHGEHCRFSESERGTHPLGQSNKTEASESPVEPAVKTLQRDSLEQEVSTLTASDQDAEAGRAQYGKAEASQSVQTLQEKLKILEAKLTQATEELERTNSLLKEQIEENKVKEEKILQLSEGMIVEVWTAGAHDRPRRESIEAGTETERVDFTNQETETESPGTVDQGTDTDRICIEVCLPEPSAGSADQGPAEADTRDQVTETESEAAARTPPRPRADSMERGTVTERIATQDQTTETPVAERVNQVTETEGAAVTDHPQRPRASSADRGTETERVGTVDRVTETEAAQRTDQQTETELDRRHDNNPSRDAGTGSQPEEGVSSEGRGDVDPTVSDGVRGKEANERSPKDRKDVVVKVAALEEATGQTSVLEPESQNEGQSSAPAVIVIKESGAQDTAKTPETVESKPTGAKPTELESVERKPTAAGETVCAIIKEAVLKDKVVIVSEEAAVKTAAPVRPQRGRKPSAEQPSAPQLQPAPVRPRRGSSETQGPAPQTKTQDAPQPEQPSTKITGTSTAEGKTQSKRPPGDASEKKPQSQPQAESQGPLPAPSEVQTRPKSIKALQKGSSVSQPSSRVTGEAKARPTRQASTDLQSQPQGSRRKSSSEGQPPPRNTSETQSPRRGSGEAAPRRGSSEAQASRRDSAESQPPRRGSSESPTSPAALGQVVTRLTGLLGEQWAQLGSGSGAPQAAVQPEGAGAAHKQAAGKRAEPVKGAAARPAGRGAAAAKGAAAAAGKPAAKAGASKMSSIQSQLVSSLSVLSAFYSPGQKAAAASKQQEQGLKSIMKKNGAADKQGTKGAKKNLKFVGVNGGYETTSSEESSGDEKTKVEEEEADSSEPEVEKEKEPMETPEEAAETQETGAEASAAEEKKPERGLMDPEGFQELLEEQAQGEKVDKGFIDACLYVKDRMEEVSSPDKEMRQVLVVLYQEWFRVSSQKESDADTVRLYLRQVGLTTPTLLPYVVNLTDGNGNMALHYSVSHSNFPVVKLLLDTGLCETDNVNKAGYTPVMLAALTAAETPDDLEAAQQLLRLGDVDARSRQMGQTALMLAVSHGRVAMVKLLLSCGADVNAQDREGSTALMCASEHGHTHIVRLLLETGRCDTGLTDKNDQTALSVAEAASHQDIVELLKAETPSAAGLL